MWSLQSDWENWEEICRKPIVQLAFWPPWSSEQLWSKKEEDPNKVETSRSVSIFQNYLTFWHHTHHQWRLCSHWGRRSHRFHSRYTAVHLSRAAWPWRRLSLWGWCCWSYLEVAQITQLSHKSKRGYISKVHKVRVGFSPWVPTTMKGISEMGRCRASCW